MTIPDIVLLGILLFFVWNGYMTGFVMQVIRFIGGFIAFWAAKTYSPALARWLAATFGPTAVPPAGPPELEMIGSLFPGIGIQGGYGVLAFAIVFLAGLLLTGFAGRLLDLVFSLPGLSFVNRLAGLFAGLVIGSLVLVVIVNLAIYVPDPSLQSALKNSQVATIVLESGVSRMLFAR